ncbi:unnamed protein product, partial [Rotaria sp. Silwood2]
NFELLLLENTKDQIKINNIRKTTKVIIFTRTSSYVIGLNQQSKNELFTNNTDDDEDMNGNEKIEILNLVSI